MTRPVYVAGTGSYLPGEPIAYARIHEVLGEISRRTDPLLPCALPIEQLHQQEQHPVGVYADWHRSAVVVGVDAAELSVAPEEKGRLVELPQVFPYLARQLVQVRVMGDQRL